MGHISKLSIHWNVAAARRAANGRVQGTATRRTTTEAAPRRTTAERTSPRRATTDRPRTRNNYKKWIRDESPKGDQEGTSPKRTNRNGLVETQEQEECSCGSGEQGGWPRSAAAEWARPRVCTKKTTHYKNRNVMLSKLAKLKGIECGCCSHKEKNDASSQTKESEAKKTFRDEVVLSEETKESETKTTFFCAQPDLPDDPVEAARKHQERESKKAEVRRRLQEASRRKKSPKGDLTPEKRKKLRAIFRLKAAEDLKSSKCRKYGEEERAESEAQVRFERNLRAALKRMGIVEIPSTRQ